MNSTSQLQINGIAVTYRKRTSLKPHAQNPNTHSPKQVELTIRDFGWTNPIIVDDEDAVLAGHGRLLAAAKLGIAEVPTICLGHMRSPT